MKRSAPARLFHADALALADLVPAGTVDLAYLDPPFAVGVAFRARTARGEHRARGPVAYDDRWDTLDHYLAWLEARLAVVRDLLAPRGAMWLHLDARAVHDAKCRCDRVFGAAAFRGEIIWVPGNGIKSRHGPGLGHQTLLLYARRDDYVCNARDPVLREPHAATSLSMHFRSRDESGRLYRDRTVGKKTYRYYADEGRALGTVWTDCPSMVANTPLSPETTGYPTQKPKKLLDRIVRATSDDGATVLDPFAGSGTTLEAAVLAGRRAIGADVSPLAIRTIEARMERAGLALEIVRPPLRRSPGAPTASAESPKRGGGRARPPRTTGGTRRG